MKPKFLIFGVIFALLLGALLLANNRRQQSAIYILSQYPRSDNLNYLTQKHLQNSDQLLFSSDWFDQNKTGVNRGCQISATLSQVCAVSSSNAAQAASVGAVTPAQIAAFDKIAPTLPPNAATPPPLADLLIVSFRSKGQWTTRIYNRAQLPPTVVRAHQILGIEGFDRRQ